MSRVPVIAPPDVPVFIMTRVFAAPRALVWKAYTDPVLFAQWWGPEGFTNKIHDMEVRVGGKWKIDNVAPDGQTFTFWGEIVELQDQVRIAQTFHFMDFAPNLDILVLEDAGDGTRMTSTTVLTSLESRTGMMQSGMEGGAQASYDRLERLLAGG
jgi:uncharacterized protein YndB with AHSA1/START domain